MVSLDPVVEAVRYPLKDDDTFCNFAGRGVDTVAACDMPRATAKFFPIQCQIGWC